MLGVLDPWVGLARTFRRALDFMGFGFSLG